MHLSSARVLTAFVGALALAACGEATPRASFEVSKTAPSAGTATSILNAGVMTELGEVQGNGSIKFLFDPLYDDHFGSLEELPPELIEAIVSGAPPYDAVDAVFVSHAHGDHFSASQLTRLMVAQPKVQIVAPEQAVARMRVDANWQAEFESRVTAITLENGEASQGFELAGAMIEAFRSPHNGWPESHSNVHNITYRVSARAGDGLTGRIMHLGDADPAAEHYAALTDFLAAKRTGLAMVPFWFYQQDDLEALIGETLNAQMPAAMHVPARVPAYLENGEFEYFSEVGEVLEIPATR